MAVATGRQAERMPTKDFKELKERASEYARLLELQSLSFGFRILLALIKAYKWFMSLKLRYLVERRYRKYKDNIMFRNAMEGLLLQIYEEVKGSMSEKQFLEFAGSLALSEEIKELIREDAEEALHSYRLREACRANEERLKSAVREFKRKINALPSM
jgi:hypothetical protein